MLLSSGQKTTFRNWLNTTASGLIDVNAAVLANQSYTNASGLYYCWQSAAKKANLNAVIVKADYTPSDIAPSGTDMLYQNRALLCQLKQTNAQWLTLGTDTINAQLTSVRQDFKDCLTQIPSGANGANQDAGWGGTNSPGAVRLALMRTITNFEQLFVSAGTGVGQTGDPRGMTTNPDVFGLDVNGSTIEGAVTAQFVSDVLAGLQ